MLHVYERVADAYSAQAASDPDCLANLIPALMMQSVRESHLIKRTTENAAHNCLGLGLCVSHICFQQCWQLGLLLAAKFALGMRTMLYAA